jgi:predicted anti-sigma-YlaC factor YlaD
MRLDCKHVWPYLSDYIDGSVSQEERDAIELHLEHCEICSAILDSVHNILVLTADDRVFRLPVGYNERLHARIEQELKRASADDSSTNADDGSAHG